MLYFETSPDLSFGNRAVHYALRSGSYVQTLTQEHPSHLVELDLSDAASSHSLYTSSQSDDLGFYESPTENLTKPASV